MALDKIRTELIADDAVTAAKIPAGAVGTTEIAEGALSVHALQNTTSHTLSGTYSDSKMYTSDAYVLGGNITVNSNLILSSVKGDSSDITLTDDGTTRTITGTGKLEGGAIVAKANTDLTGMTGELGSVITGSPNLNLTTGTLGSNVTFPVGHVIQVVGNQTAFSITDFAVTNSTVKDADGNGLTISGVTAGNLLKINIAGGYHRMYGASNATGGCNWKIVASPNTGADTLVSGTRLFMRDYNSDYLHVGISLIGMYIVPSGVTSVEILRELTATTINSTWNSINETPMSSSIMEIQQ